MLSIDVNADLGEGCPWDEQLLDRVTSASICCGAHAGDDAVILDTLQVAKRKGVAVGAHPGYPDRTAFGRRDWLIGRPEVAELVTEQLQHLNSLAAVAGVSIHFVKPHGALYNQAQRDPEIALGIIDAVKQFSSEPLRLLGLPGSTLADLARAHKLVYIAEGFADRGYQTDGQLIRRGQPGAILESASDLARQVIELSRGGRVQTICIHGDDPRAVAAADLVRGALGYTGVRISSFVS